MEWLSHTQQPSPVTGLLASTLRHEERAPDFSIVLLMTVTSEIGSLIAYRHFLWVHQKMGDVFSIDLPILCNLEKSSNIKEVTHFLVARSHLSVQLLVQVIAYFKCSTTRSVHKAKLIQRDHPSVCFCRTK